jgi:hypothetical protein
MNHPLTPDGVRIPVTPNGDDFDGAREPMRALRDLISSCEMVFGDDNGEQDILRRAQDGFTTLRKLFGDNRLAEDTAFGSMREPPLPLPDQPPGCKKVRDVVITLLKQPMDADIQVDDGEEFRDFTIERVTSDDPDEPQLVAIKPE